MRRTLMATALALFAAAPALAQPGYGAPPGSYQRQCSNIRMEGQFLHATCRGAHGSGDSSINVQSCSTDIFVDDTGGLKCVGPGGGAPPQVRAVPPGYNTGQGQGYDHGNDRRDERGYGGAYERRGRGERPTAVLYDRRGYRGGSVRIDGPTPNLGPTGINDRVRSIALERRSGPWLVCSNAGYRGRCLMIRDSVADTRSLGLGDISSLRPQ